jgi:hypothetical protein
MNIIDMQALQDGSFYDYDYFDNPEPPTSIGYRGYSEQSINPILIDLAVSLFQPKTCLDLGCAKGFYVAQFRDRGVNTWGVDISQYAIDTAPAAIKKYLFCMDALEFCQKRPFRIGMPPKKAGFSLVFMHDLLEHLPQEKAMTLIEILPSLCNGVFSCFAALPENDHPHRVQYETEWRNAPEHLSRLPWPFWEAQFQKISIPYFIIYTLRFGHWNADTVLWRSNLHIDHSQFGPLWEAFLNSLPG